MPLALPPGSVLTQLLGTRQGLFFVYLFYQVVRPAAIPHLDSGAGGTYIHIYLYLLYFFTHIHLKRLRLINIFRCPVTMAIGSADIIFNLIFQLPQ